MRARIAAGLLIGLVPVGCLSVYPKLEHIPAVAAVAAGTTDDEFHAFRVEVTDTRAGYDSPNRTRMILTPLPVEPDGQVPGQYCLSLESSFQSDDGPIGPSDAHRWHGMRVRLYRPGYHLEERWPGSSDIIKVWPPAESLEAREKAVDDLFTTWTLGNYSGAVFTGRFGHVAPGGASKGHRESLLFAAGEYERVAALAIGIDGKSLAARERLLDKAARLRKLAEKDDKPSDSERHRAPTPDGLTPSPAPPEATAAPPPSSPSPSSRASQTP
jgi:hypothetical protein